MPRQPQRGPHADLQASSPARRRHRSGGHARGREARRMVPRQRHRLRDRDRSRGRLGLRRPQGGDHRRRDGARASGRCGAVRRRRRAEVGRRALRRPARGGAPAPAQGPRPVRQPAAGDLLSRARRRLVAQARGRGGTGPPDRARAHRRGLFRRAEGDRDPRERIPARRRHAALHHGRDRAHRAGRLRSREEAARQGLVGREAQRDEDRRAVEAGGVTASTRRSSRTSSSNTSSRTTAPCSSCAGRSNTT